MVVEDDAGFRTTLCMHLEEAGYRIAAVNERSVGADILRDTRPSLLIVDAGLPGGDGKALAKLARSLGVPVLLISGDPEAMTKHREDPLT